MKIINIIILSLFLASCSMFERQVEYRDRLVPQTTYVEREDIDVPSRPILKHIEKDMPRDMDADLVVKNIESCRDVETKDEDFWARCGEKPVTGNSNIFIGVDQDNYNKQVENQGLIKAYIRQLEELINTVNKQRQDTRNKNNK